MVTLESFPTSENGNNNILVSGVAGGDTGVIVGNGNNTITFTGEVNGNSTFLQMGSGTNTVNLDGAEAYQTVQCGSGQETFNLDSALKFQLTFEDFVPGLDVLQFHGVSGPVTQTVQ